MSTPCTGDRCRRSTTLLLGALGLLVTVVACDATTSDVGGGGAFAVGTAAVTDSTCDAAAGAAAGDDAALTVIGHHNFLRVQQAGLELPADAVLSARVEVRGSDLTLRLGATGGTADPCRLRVTALVKNLQPGTAYRIEVTDADGRRRFGARSVATAPADDATAECRAAYDCDHLGLAHPACVGAWACASARCVWICEGADACTADDDCREGFFCARPRCGTIAPGEPNPSTPADPTGDAPRADGALKCGGTAGICRPRPARCASDADCAQYPVEADAAGRRPASACVNGACVAGPGPSACAVDADCPRDWLCRPLPITLPPAPDASGTARTPPPPTACVPAEDPDRSCTGDADCPRGSRCEELALGVPCRVQDDGTYDCPSNPRRCVPTNVEAECETDADCGPGRVCEHRVYFGGSGGGAASPGGAPAGSETPVPPPPSGEDGGPGILPGPSGVCREQRLEEIACRTADDCRGYTGPVPACVGGFVCRDGLCGFSCSAACSADRDCPDGLVCRFDRTAAGDFAPSGVCGPREDGCRSDADCGPGRICRWMTPPPVDPQPLPAGDDPTRPPPACAADSDCPAGAVCVEGACKPGDGPTLPPPPPVGECVDAPPGECRDDTDCAAGEQCLPTPCAAPPLDENGNPPDDYRCPSFCVPKPDDRCAVMDCAPGYYCRDGECLPDTQPDPCATVRCRAGYECRNGECVEVPTDPCAAVLCAEGTFCRGGACLPLGACAEPSDCEGQPIVHPMCVGVWACDAGRCRWDCGTDPDECAGAGRGRTGVCQGPNDAPMPDRCCAPLECDPGKVVCRMSPGECPAGMIRWVVDGCWGGCTVPDACVDLIGCDQTRALCDAMPPRCPPGQTASVRGTCYGPCVPENACGKPWSSLPITLGTTPAR